MPSTALVPVPAAAYAATNIGSLGLVAAYNAAAAAGAVGAAVPLASLGQSTGAMQVNFTPALGGTQDAGFLLVSTDGFVTDIAVATVVAASGGQSSFQVPLIGTSVRFWKTTATPGAVGNGSCSVAVIAASGGAGGPAWITSGNTLAGATGLLGTTDASPISGVVQGVQWLAVGATAAGRPVALLPGTGGLGLGVAAPGASGLALDTPGAGALTVGTANATSVSVGSATASMTLSSFALLLTSATSVNMTATTAANLFANAVDYSRTFGGTTGASALGLLAGTGGVTISALGNSPILANAVDYSRTFGGTTGASPLALQAGTGALTLRRNGNTWTWPSTFGAAGSVLTDAAGNGTLSWATAAGASTNDFYVAVNLTPSATFAAGTAISFPTDQAGSPGGTSITRAAVDAFMCVPGTYKVDFYVQQVAGACQVQVHLNASASGGALSPVPYANNGQTALVGQTDLTISTIVQVAAGGAFPYLKIYCVLGSVTLNATGSSPQTPFSLTITRLK
jgi:hypothetical protein